MAFTIPISLKTVTIDVYDEKELFGSCNLDIFEFLKESKELFLQKDIIFKT